MEVFANNATSTLNGSINNSVTSLVVNSASSFPTTGNFAILVDQELMLVTGVSGTTFTVTRGIESSSAASHASGAPVTHILTAATMPRFRKASIGYDTLANRPAAGNEGALYFATDHPQNLFRDNGSSWDTLIVANTNAQNLLGSNTNLSTAGLTDLCSLSLAAGTWLLNGVLALVNTGSGDDTFLLVLYYGTTKLVAIEQAIHGLYSHGSAISCIVTLTSTQTVKMAAQGFTNTFTARQFGDPDFGANSIPGTLLSAVKLG